MAGWESAPSPSGWETAPDKPKVTASGWEQAPDTSPWGVVKEAGKATWEDPLSVPGAAIKALAGGLVGTGEAAVGGIVGLGAGGVSAAQGKGFMPGFERGMAGTEQVFSPLTSALEPGSRAARAFTNVLGLYPELAEYLGGKTSDIAGPEAGAAVKGGTMVLPLLLPFLRHRGDAGKGIPKPPPAPKPYTGTAEIAARDKMPEPRTFEKPTPSIIGKPPETPALALGPPPEQRTPLGTPKPEGMEPVTGWQAKMPKPQTLEPEIGRRLTTRLVQLGGVNIEEAADAVGESRARTVRMRPGLFRISKGVGGGGQRVGNSLSTLIADGKLDEYLPYELRASVGDFTYERAYEAEEFIREQIARDLSSKDVGPFENMLARKQAEQGWEQARGEPIDPFVDPFEVMDEVGLKPEPELVGMVAKSERARAIDPDAYERIPENLDDAGYAQAIEEILAREVKEPEGAPYAQQPSQASAPSGAPPGGAPPGPPAAPGAAQGAPPPGVPPAAGAGAPPSGPPAGPPPGPAAAVPGQPPVGPMPRRQMKAPVTTPQAQPNAMADAIQRVFAPATRGPRAGRTAGIVRENVAKLARDTVTAQARLEKFGSLVDKLDDAARYEFIDAMETGRPQANARLQPMADEIRKMLDERRDTVQKLGAGALETYIENYFPHIWKDPNKVAAALEEHARQQFGKRPLTGSGSFLKERSIPTTKEGLDLGLEPISSNPVDLALIKIREMDRFVMGTRVMQEMKGTGLAQFTKFGRPAPEGWKKIDDKTARVLQWDEEAKGFILRGEYYAPEEAATIINNYLKPGLVGNPIYDTVRGAGNLLNMMQLGFSAFHAGFTTFDAMVSKTSLGLKQLAQGDVKGALNVGKGMLISEAVANVWRGQKLHKAYMNPGTGGPLLESIVDGLVAGGGRVKMDQFYAATRSGSYWDSIAHKRFINELTKKGVARGAAEFFPRLVQTISAPIMEWLVPRQKLGVFMDMMRQDLERNPGMTPEQLRVRAGKLWDSVDNRLGEMVYDNLFWNKTIKDLSFVGVRSVGWNLGTIRELGGGVVDWGRQAKSAAQGRGFTMTDRMAYTAALPMTTALYGAIITYLFTGEGPQEIKDYFFPKTGRDTREGFPERLSLPTYMKDVVEYYHAPAQTVVNKMNPLISAMSQMYKNEDFYGAQIRDTDADALRQTQQFLMYLGKQIEPFSLRSYQRQREEGAPAWQSALSGVGLNPSPAFITRPPETQRLMETMKQRGAIRKRMREELK